jgi:hypothetical protein
VAFSVGVNTGTARVGTLVIGDQTVTVNQAATLCSFTINPTTLSVGAAGGGGSQVVVSTTSGCAWSASSSAPWITVTSAASVTGPGNVNFSVAANTGFVRNGTLTIAGQAFTVTQAAAAASCSYSINPASQSIGGAAGTANPVAVSTSPGCSWTAAANVPWITIASGSTGSGNGSVTFTVSANTGAPRTGSLTIAGQMSTVTQATNCSYSISPSSKSSSDKGGDVTSSVTAPPLCSWTATSNAPWITVTSGASGSGDGKVTFRVAENLDKFERIGTLTIAGKTFTVTQNKH